MAAEMKLITGETVLVDSEDLSYLSQYRWYLNNGYARSYIKGKRVYMHRLLLETPKTLDVDHANGNKLDNRRSNIRECSRTQNNYNLPNKSNTASGFRGVVKRVHKTCISWIARARISGKTIYLGAYKTPEEAGLVFHKFARENYGEFYRRASWL